MKHQLRCQQLFQRGPLSFHVLHPYSRGGPEIFFVQVGSWELFWHGMGYQQYQVFKKCLSPSLVELIFMDLPSTNRGNHNTSYGSEEPSLPTSQPPISSQHTNLPALLVSCQPALLNLSHPQGTSKANYLFGSCYRIQIIIIFPDILVSSEEYSMTYLQFFKQVGSSSTVVVRRHSVHFRSALIFIELRAQLSSPLAPLVLRYFLAGK